MTTTRADCLVIGAGLPGAVYALQAARAGLHVTLITGAEELQASNSLWAQGGIIFDEVDGDLLRADIDAASAHSANLAVVDAVVEDGPRVVRELLIDDLQVASTAMPTEHSGSPARGPIRATASSTPRTIPAVPSSAPCTPVWPNWPLRARCPAAAA